MPVSLIKSANNSIDASNLPRSMNPSSTGSTKLPEVKQSLDDHFAGRPVSKQNLSEWRSGGFSEWLDRQDAGDFLTNLDDQPFHFAANHFFIHCLDRAAFDDG